MSHRPTALRQPSRRLGRPLPRRRRGLRDPRGGRQCDRCRLRRRHRARRAAARRGERRRRGADHDPHCAQGRTAGKVVTIAGLGHWPARFPADLFMREHGGKMPLGVLRTVVPAAPDAWITALERLRHDVVRRRRAVPPSATPARASRCIRVLATMIEQYEDGYRSWPSNAAIFLPGGQLPQVGDRFVQTDLAGTLQYMVDQERAAAKRGPHRPACRRRAPPSIAATSRDADRALPRAGGRLSRRATISPTSTAATSRRCSVRWRDFEVFTCGPWCQGPMLAQALRWWSAGGLDGPGAQQRRLPPPASPRCVKAALRRPRVPLRRSAVRRCRSDELLVRRPSSPAARRRDRPRASPDMPPPLGRHPGDGRRPTAQRGATPTRRARHLLLLRRRSLGQRVQRDAVGRIVASPVIPGLGIVPSGRGTQSGPIPRIPPAWRRASGRG